MEMSITKIKEGSETAKVATIAPRSRVANIGGTIDADGARCDLAQRHYIRELLLRDPALLYYHFVLHKREHGIAPSEAEESNFDISPKEL